MYQVPELLPVYDMPDVVKTDFTAGIVPMNALSLRPLWLLAHMMIHSSPKGQTTDTIFSKVNALLGEADAPQIDHRVNQRILEAHLQDWATTSTGLCETTNDKDAIRYTSTDRGRQCLSLLGVAACFQLRHATSLVPLAGRFEARPGVYQHVGERHLQVLRLLASRQFVHYPDLVAEFAGSSGAARRGLDNLARHGVVSYFSTTDPRHRRLALLPEVLEHGGGRPSSVTGKALRSTVERLCQGGDDVRIVSAAELINATLAQGGTSYNLLHRQLQVANLPKYLRYVDEDVYGADSTRQKGASIAFSLNEPSRPPVEELLLSVWSLRQAGYRDRVTTVVDEVLQQPAMVADLLRVSSRWPYPAPNTFPAIQK